MDDTSYYYTIPYVVVLFLFLFLGFLDVKLTRINKDYIRVISVCLFFWFFGFRGFVGSDFTSYYLFYKDIPSILNLTANDFLNWSFFEPGFIFFSSIIKLFSSNYHFFVFVNTIIDITLLLIVLKRYSNEYLVYSLAVFFVFGSEFEINLVRNIKSILLFLFSLKFLEERKFFPYFFVNLIGLSFHSTAIFFMPLYSFLHRSSKKIFFLVFFIGCVLYFLQIKYIALIAGLLSEILGGIYLAKATIYLESESSGITLAFLYIFVPFILIYKNYDKIVSKNNYNILFVNMFLLYCVANLYFTEILVFRSRFGALFVLSLCILFPQILSEYKTRKLHSYALNFIFYILFFSKIILTNTPLPNFYDNLTFGIMNYDKRISNMNQYSSESYY
ncbi:EpsG family protein [Flavobacterium pectinovorum]|uniref:EpsG family protein n=1 Tax=Flavobacterium pectinovorum TaxID=29533 RepID=UPI001FACEAE3|nr:EpsG family protein [Flavobacterium pectinovorum]MCI9843865.1 EpsG family protein [Flavobacterium pectinovorum]